MSTVSVCKFDDLGVAEACKFVVEGHKVCVVRIEDSIYAIGDTCSHADVSLSEGDVYPDECEIECIKHGSTFSLKTGEPQTFPATQPVPVYDAAVVDGMVHITITPGAHK